MNLRKEQVLLIAALLLGAYSYKSMQSGEAPQYRFSSETRDYTPEPLPASVLAAPVTVAVPKRDWCREPSETQPLPPRPLAFPARPPLSVIGLPLQLGPDFAEAQLLRVSGEVVEGVELAGAAGGNSAAPPPTETNEPQAATSTQADKMARYEKLYDRVWNLQNVKVPQFGILEYPGGDPFDLEEPGCDFSDKKVYLQRFSLEKEKLLPGRDLLDGKEITKVRLKENLGNEVAREVRKVPPTLGNLQDRRRLIDWLLQKGREDASIYDEAQKQAKLFFDQAKSLEGLQLIARVLRARGDLQAEYELYQKLPERFADSAFRFEGLGKLEARLGLDADAERDLRAAVQRGPQDSRLRSSLADFLRTHGRAKAATAEADQALANIGVVTDQEELERVVRILVGCRLAVGDIDGAREVLRRAPDAPAYLSGCVDYAAGQLPLALEAFQQAAGSADAMPAALGVGASQLRLGKDASDAQWQAAQAAFLVVGDQAPLLRHRALTGMALLCLRIGQRDQASSYLDRALEAAPGDLYALYLRARLLRDGGDLQQAQQVLTEVLQKRDDFVYALAERATLHAQIGEGASDLEQAQNFVAAMRYADRAVALAPKPVPLELIELQARLHFLAADLPGAEAAFAAARELASSEPDKLFGRAGQILCDYKRNHVDDTRNQLLKMIDDLPKDQSMRLWAEATLKDIDDHSQKEQLDDRFDRAELGNLWKRQSDAQLRPEVKDNQLVLAGKLSRIAEVNAERIEVIKRAGNFLAVEVGMQVGSKQARDTDCGLRIKTVNRGGSQSGFEAWIGLHDGNPYLRIQDGKDEPITVPLQATLEADKPVRLRFEVVPRDQAQKQFALQCYWNGVLVYEDQKLTNLQRGTPGELLTILFARGAANATLDVRFDDYHLERRKDN